MELFELFDLDQFRLDYQRIYNLLNSQYKDYESYRSMMIMRENWEKLAKRLMFEEVVCRQKRKLTNQYQKLHKEFKICQEELEQSATMYSLLNM